MLSWRRQQSIDISHAVAELGAQYGIYFQRDEGLPISANRELARVAGMRAEQLMNLTAEGWAGLLQRLDSIFCDGLNDAWSHLPGST